MGCGGWIRAGALQMTTAGQGFASTGFRRAFEGADFIFVTPDKRAFGIFLTVGFLDLLHVVGAVFENDACFLGVQVDNHLGVAIACVGKPSPRAHKVRGG